MPLFTEVVSGPVDAPPLDAEIKGAIDAVVTVAIVAALFSDLGAARQGEGRHQDGKTDDQGASHGVRTPVTS